MMTKTENRNNNLFKWATKELSQDAILAWLLNDDEIGYDLIKDMCPSLKSVDFEIENITTQKYSIDVLVELCVLVTGEKIAVIIEDKTDTYLHDHQMLKYIEKISRENQYHKIIFVLFKTGNIFTWEKEHYLYWKKEIENGNRLFKSKKLVDSLDNGLIISGASIEKSIEISKKVDEIIIENIYSLENFQKFLHGTKERNEVLNHFLNFISNEKNTNCEDDENNYCIAKEVISDEKYQDVKLRMILPGGAGKREFEFCFCSNRFCSEKPRSTSEIEKISDNFLILPFIRKVVKNSNVTYQYTINYNLIGDLSKLHGFIKYDQLKLSSKQKEIFREFKIKVSDYAKKLKAKYEGFELSKDKRDSRLKVLSFKDTKVTKENINKLLNIAFELSKCISEEK